MKKVTIMLFLFVFFQLICFACLAEDNPKTNYIPLNQDKTLSLQQYYSLGIPERIESPEDISITIKTLYQLLNNKIEQLPRYNSAKSSYLYNYLTSHESIDAIIKSLKTYKEQQYFLLNYFAKGQTLADIYCIAPLKYKYYYNEQLICVSACIYANIRFLELFEEQAKNNGQSINELFDKNQKKIFTQQIGRSYWGLEQMLQGPHEIDPVIIQLINNDLKEMKSRIINLKIIDQSIVFDSDKCWEL